MLTKLMFRCHHQKNYIYCLIWKDLLIINPSKCGKVQLLGTKAINENFTQEEIKAD
jgi:hypothetical protein